MALLTVSTEELRKTETKLKITLKVYSGFSVAVLIILILFRASFVAYIPIMMLPLTCSPMLTQLKSVRTELKNRFSINH